MNKLGIKLVKWLFTRHLTIEEANELTRFILKEMGALPFKDVIKFEENRLLINDKPLEIEQMKRLREGAIAALENATFTLIRDQVAFKAITIGVHNAETPVQILFARAAIWWGQQEHQLLETLATQDRQVD